VSLNTDKACKDCGLADCGGVLRGSYGECGFEALQSGWGRLRCGVMGSIRRTVIC
jgi:hypothetical protein